MTDAFQEIALLLAAAASIGALAIRLRQPLILAYIVVGILAGPVALGWITVHDPLDLLAQVGVAVLLFTVGLKLDLHLVRRLGAVALATGLGQLFFTILFGYLLGLALGMDHLKAIYIAVALTFSSTIIIVKLLSDKKELDSLHGRIAVGFLIVQDIAVLIAMMTMSTLNMAEADGIAATLGMITLKLAVAGLLLTAVMRYVLPRLLDLVARSQELMLLFAIAWGVALASLGEMFGFSKEVGAFLAGFSLATSPYREAMSGRLNPVRDFLLLFFFLDLGAKLEFQAFEGQIVAALVLSAFVLIGNPLIVMAIMGYMGYRKRTGFMAGLTVAQISEFSIVFVAMGVSLGHVGGDALGLVTLVGLVTISVCTYLVLNSQILYEKLKLLLSVFERRIPFREQHGSAKIGADACGDRVRSRALRREADAAPARSGHQYAGCGFRSRSRAPRPPSWTQCPLRRCRGCRTARQPAPSRGALGGQHLARYRHQPRSDCRPARARLHRSGRGRCAQ